MEKLIDCLKVGDKVFDITLGWGEIRELRNEPTIDGTSIKAQFKNGEWNFYTDEGKTDSDNINPSLFLHEIKLEQELPEFVEGEIVLVSDSQYWMLAVYNLYNEHVGQHSVKLINEDLTLSSNLLFRHCKSFDKSHFE
jgi:hypothetical protein